MNFQLTMGDYTMILNALHYYKKANKKGNFVQFDDVRVRREPPKRCGRRGRACETRAPSGRARVDMHTHVHMYTL